ncbi:hypothetical protein JCGZ_20484 [Jatropha curcas]|uniref:NAB domain-containing protein n=2 Tax=Jatropha curcas TaxID=180498 RepID=A0A067JR97_JATCU|nr:hypothetical protein JCGZ_20484 [Jatropha curcas]
MSFIGKSPRARKRELSTLVKVHESQGSAQIKELEGQLTVLRMELESVRSLKNDLEINIEDKEKEARVLGDTNANLHTRISELELISEKKGNEISAMTDKMEENMRQIKNLQVEIDSLRLEKAEEESKRKEVSAQVKVMQQELESFRTDKTELQLQLNIKTKAMSENLIQIERLKDEIARKTTSENGLPQEKEILKLEVNSLHEKNRQLEELLESRKNDRLEENEASSQIMALKEKVNSLQRELDSLQSEDATENKEHRLTKHRSLDFARSLHIDPNISPRQRSSTVSPRYRSVDSTRLNHNVLERKIDELAAKFEMKTENHIRLLSQRIRVAEQIHVETRESCKKIQAKLDQENKQLNEKKATYEAEVKKMKDMLLKQGSNILTGLDLMVRKLDEENDNFINRISRISDELQIVNNWITKKDNEIKKLKHNLENLEEEEFLLREKVGKLETELNAAVLEPSKQDAASTASQLERRVEDLEQQLKERDQILSSLGDEKRDAIRQLCILIDYHRHRCDRLKEAVAKMNVKFKKSA